MPTSRTSAPRKSPGRSAIPPKSNAPAEGEARICGAPTTKGGTCRIKVAGEGHCPVHGGRAEPAAANARKSRRAARAAPATPSDADAPLPAADPMERLRLLQEAAEKRAFEAYRADEGGGDDKLDAAFNRNARLVATLARTRHALSRAQGQEHGDEAGADGAAKDGQQEEIVEIPDNQR